MTRFFYSIDQVQNLEHTSHENGQNVQNLKDMLHRLDGDINNISEKIDIEADWREKEDNELNNKIDQVCHKRCDQMLK